MNSTQSQSSAVGITLRAGQLRIKFRCPSGAKIFMFSQSLETGSGAHATLYLKGAFYSEIKWP